LFKGIAKTYFRGEKSATIDDLKLFSSNTVEIGTPVEWINDEEFNRKSLPENVLKSLEESKTESFLVVKDGKLLHEQYWKGYDENTRSNSFSKFKTVAVMLTGKALEEGKIESLDSKFTDFYDNYTDTEFGRDLTLRHLAAMESGLNW